MTVLLGIAVVALLIAILNRQGKIMADTQANLAKIATVSQKLDNISADILKLQGLVTAGGTPQEIADAIDALVLKATGVDDQEPTP